MGCIYSSMYGGLSGWFLKAVIFVLASFVFSVVFWVTKHWLEATPKKNKK